MVETDATNSAGPGLRLTVHEDPGTVRFELSGELDVASASQLDERLSTVALGPDVSLELDLRGLEFMDSSGLRAILRADAQARRDGASMALVRGPEPVDRVFALTRLHERLSFVEAPGDASG